MKRILTKNVQRNFFVIFLYLPEILLVATTLFSFIFGIIDANTAYIDIYSGLINYGAFGFKSKFATFILWLTIGIFGSLINWAVLRILISPITMLVMNGDAGFVEKQEGHPQKSPVTYSNHTQEQTENSVVKKPFYKQPTQVQNSIIIKNSQPMMKPRENKANGWMCTCGMHNSPKDSDCQNCYKPRPK